MHGFMPNLTLTEIFSRADDDRSCLEFVKDSERVCGRREVGILQAETSSKFFNTEGLLTSAKRESAHINAFYTANRAKVLTLNKNLCHQLEFIH